MENPETAAPKASKSPATNSVPKFKDLFNAKLAEWRKQGCPVWDKEELTDKAGEACGAAPHMTKMNHPKDGVVRIDVSCAAGHLAAWTYDVAEDMLKANAQRQTEEAAAGGGRDPMKASVTISLDVRTQEISIDAFVPTPGLGLQLAAILTAHFTKMFNEGSKPAKLFTPPRTLLHPQTGKALNA